MARSISLSPERPGNTPRKRERSRSPKEQKKEKKHKKSHRRSRSPREERRRRERSRERPRSPSQRHEDGELTDDAHRRDPGAGAKQRTSSKTDRQGVVASREDDRSKSKERHRSKSQERRRSLSRERRKRSPHRDRRRSKSRDRNRKSKSPERRRRSVSREEGTAALASNKQTERGGEIEGNGTANGHAERKAAPAQPLSLDEVLKKRKEEEEALAKPKFLSRQERERLALERLKEKADAKKQVGNASNGNHNPFGSTGFSAAARRREADRKAEEDRQKRHKDKEKDIEERERDKELELIKKQYLGSEKTKKKIRKPSEKFHLNFDWEASDDTSRDLNPIYNSTHEAALLFGSGRRAGVDIQQQKTSAAEYRNQQQKKARAALGLEETEEDRKRDRARTRQAQLYDSQANKNTVKEHWSNKTREEMTERDWRIFREDYNISYKGVNVTGAALPYRNWEEAPLPDELMRAIHDLGYKKPSPIQMASIPLGLLQRDVIGVAETGSGKTASFVLPMLCYIKKKPYMTEEIATQGPYAVIMAPVRELAQQIEEETRKLAIHTKYRTVSIVGGQEITAQGFLLRKGCEIVVATPGRLKDCLDQSYAVLNQCDYVVLDEADRMIEMGFLEQVTAVLDAMPSSNLKPEEEGDGVLEEERVYRTTYMFSATMPPPVERLARKYMRRPAVINIGSAGKATDNVTQKVYLIKDNEKLHHLENELNAINEKRSIVFVNTKKSCDIVSRRLDELGYSCTMLHGSKTQDQREASLAGFREEKYNVLVATDVAGRGIDVPDVALVINYDMPNAIEHYTHRIGRTARAGKQGTAVTFLTPQDTDMYYDLKKFLEDSKAAIPPQLLYHEAAKRPPDAEKNKRETTIYARK